MAAIAASAIAASLAPGTASAAPGDLDPSFGSGGRALHLADDDLNYADMAVDSQGRIVVVANDSGPGDIHLLRFLPTGQLDLAFGGGDGRVDFLSLATFWAPTDVAIDSEDRIVVGGRRNVSQILLARFLPSGSADTSFNNGVAFKEDIAFGINRFLEDVLVDGQDRIVIAGDEDDELMVARFVSEPGNPLALDPGFGGGDGWETVTLGGLGTTRDLGAEAAFDSLERIVVVGLADPVGAGDNNAGVARFTAAGAVDPSFSPGGVQGSVVLTGVHATENDAAQDVVIDSGDRPVVAVSIQGAVDLPVVARIGSDGVPDPSFGANGIVTSSYAGQKGGASAIALDAQGRIVLGGSVQLATDPDPFAVARMMPSGAADTTFSGDGVAFHEFDPRPAYTDRLGNVALDASGRILVGGRSFELPGGGAPTHLALARLSVTPDPPSPSGKCAGRAATLVGSPRRDLLSGTPGRDVIAGRGGNDTIRGLKGNDLLCGGRGKDRLLGGPGRDRLLGGPGRDRLLGGAGADTLLGGAGRDILRGGPGKDKLRGGPGRDRQRQ